MTSQSNDLQKRKDPENSENMDPIPENLILQHNEQLVGTVPVSVWRMVKQFLCLLFLLLQFFTGVVKTFFPKTWFVLRPDLFFFKLHLSHINGKSA